MGFILQKEKQIKISWLDWYWYAVGAYICIPYAFLRRKMLESFVINSNTLQLVLYDYHSLISSVLFMIGLGILIIKLNRGYVKYQMRRTLWTTFSLLYVFMLSTVQIYNLYQGYIWVLLPLLSVRFNAWIIKLVHQNRSQKKTPIHKYLPSQDRTSVIFAFFMTGIFAFWLSGFCSQYQHLVCKQTELSLRLFEATQCEVYSDYHPEQLSFNSKWPFIHRIYDIKPVDEAFFSIQITNAQLHLTGIALISCFVSPMMRFAAGTFNRAFNIKEDHLLLEIVGRESGLTDIFYCHGMVGVVVTLYLQQIVFRKDYYYDLTMQYVSMLNDDDKQRVATEIIKQLNLGIDVS